MLVINFKASTHHHQKHISLKNGANNVEWKSIDFYLSDQIFKLSSSLKIYLRVYFRLGAPPMRP